MDEMKRNAGYGQSEENEAPMAGPDKDERDTLREIQANVKKSKNHLTDWRNAALEAYDYFAGNQWSEEDLSKLREERRPAIVFNRIPRVINAVAGLELQNRQEVSYIPRENDDLAGSEILTSAAEWVRQNCDAEDEESQAFKDCLLTGMGWTETHLEYETDPDGAILIERIDPMDMMYDPTSTKRNLDDARWVARVRHYTKKDFESIWPEADALGASYGDPKGMQPHDDTAAPWYINDQSGNDGRDKKDEVEVIQYQCWKREPYYRVEEDNGEIQVLDVEEFGKLKAGIKAKGWRYVKQNRRVYKQYFVAGEQILEEGDCPVNMFTLRCMTGMTDHNENIWFGLTQIMKDPQMWANKWLSQTLHIVNSNAKGGYLAEVGAFQNPRQAEKNLATTSITYLNEEGLQKIQSKQPAMFPAAIDKLLEYAVSSVSDLVGVNLEMLGMANRNQPGVLEQQRKQAGITVVADFFDALRRYRKESGRVLASYITEYISDGRMIRITGDTLGKMVPLAREQLDFKYDIVVDEAPTSPNQREVVFERLTSLLPMLLEANIPIPPEIIEYAPLPAPLIQKWKEAIANTGPNPIDEEKEQLRMQLARLEAANRERDLQEKEAKILETKTKSALNIAKAEHEHALSGVDTEKARVENIQATLDVVNSIEEQLF